jgi:ribonuclease HI
VKSIVVYTDGACEGNPGPGGWAAVLKFEEIVKEVSGGEPATTNNRMEMQAAISALAVLNQECEVTLHTDSEYLKKGITEWVRGWKARGWMTMEKKPVKNQDLWRQLDKLSTKHKVSWKWVKGHAGNPDNEKCDELARNEISKLRKRFTRAQISAMVDDYKKSGTQNLPGLLL